jgi:hypothetical protein
MYTDGPYEVITFNVKTGKKIYASYCASPESQHRIYLFEIQRYRTIPFSRKKNRGVYKRTYFPDKTFQITDKVLFDDLNIKSI